jgi:hypothetical protein
LLLGCDHPGTDERLTAALDIFSDNFSYKPIYYTISFEMQDVNTLKAAPKFEQFDVFTIQESVMCWFIVTSNRPGSTQTTATFDLNKLKIPQVYPTISGLRRLIYLTGESGGYKYRSGNDDVRIEDKAQIYNVLPEEVPTYLARLAAFQQKLCGIKQ